MKAQLKARREIEYPEADGKPMAETDDHRYSMVDTIDRLNWRYRGKKVYVSGNLFIYYEEGNTGKVVSPDVFVVLNCASRRRRIFKTWEEGKGPSWVLETTSKKTKREDTGTKKVIYASLKVPEYFLFDPLGEWLKPPLQGFRLQAGEFQPIQSAADGSLISKVLGVRLILEQGELVMYDLASGDKVLSRAEAEEKGRREAEQRAADANKRLREEIAARKKLEEDIAELRRKAGTGKNGGPKK